MRIHVQQLYPNPWESKDIHSSKSISLVEEGQCYASWPVPGLYQDEEVFNQKVESNWFDSVESNQEIFVIAAE